MSAVDGDAVRAIRDLTRDGDVDVLTVVPGRLDAVVLQEGQQLETFDLEKYEASPFRKQGVVSLSHPDSFVGYVNRHKIPEATTVWSDVKSARFVAVLDDHFEGSAPTEAGWGQHRAVLALPLTEDWVFWLSKDGQLMPQQVFAEHIEQGAHCVIEPDSADMLEIAQTFQAKTGVDFKSSARLTSGETQLRYEESTAARAGVNGSIEIPDLFKLALQPYEGSPSFEVTAWFRYRIQNGTLSLGYRLIRADQARRDALELVASKIGEQVELPVLLGVPRN